MNNVTVLLVWEKVLEIAAESGWESVWNEIWQLVVLPKVPNKSFSEPIGMMAIYDGYRQGGPLLGIDGITRSFVKLTFGPYSDSDMPRFMEIYRDAIVKVYQ